MSKPKKTDKKEVVKTDKKEKKPVEKKPVEKKEKGKTQVSGGVSSKRKLGVAVGKKGRRGYPTTKIQKPKQRKFVVIIFI
jgi:hypothetical protein